MIASCEDDSGIIDSLLWNKEHFLEETRQGLREKRQLSQLEQLASCPCLHIKQIKILKNYLENESCELRVTGFFCSILDFA